MPHFAFGSDNGQNTPKKILDLGDVETFVAVQVLDASTFYFAFSRETLIDAGLGIAAPNNVQGFQVKAANGLVLFWMSGVLWGRSDTPGGLINFDVLMQRKKSGGCGCGGGCGKNPAEIK